MTEEVTSNELSTPVYRHLNGVHSWDTASKDARTAFYRAMKGRAYGFEPTLDAWNWFMQGWSASAHETTVSHELPCVCGAWKFDNRTNATLAQIGETVHRATGRCYQLDSAQKASAKPLCQCLDRCCVNQGGILGQEYECRIKATGTFAQNGRPERTDQGDSGAVMTGDTIHPPCIFRGGCKYQPHCQSLCQGPLATP